MILKIQCFGSVYDQHPGVNFILITGANELVFKIECKRCSSISSTELHPTLLMKSTRSCACQTFTLCANINGEIREICPFNNEKSLVGLTLDQCFSTGVPHHTSVFYVCCWILNCPRNYLETAQFWPFSASRCAVKLFFVCREH